MFAVSPTKLQAYSKELKIKAVNESNQGKLDQGSKKTNQ